MNLKAMTYRGKRNALVMLLFFIAVGIVWIVGYNGNYFVWPDAYDYAQMGREIRAGHGFSTLQVLPGHIPFLAEKGYLEQEHWPNLSRFVLPTLTNAFAQLFTSDAVAASIVQSGLWYLLSVPVLFLLTLRCTNMTVASLSTLFYVADPHIFESSYNGLTETLASFLILCVLLVVFVCRDGNLKWLLAGALCGLCYLARTNLVYVTPLIAVYALRPQKRPWQFAAGGLVLLSSALVVLPWCIRNQVVTDSPSFSFSTAGALGWDAAPGTPFIRLHEPADVPSMLQKHGPAIRTKTVKNAIENVISLTFWDKMFSKRGWFYPVDRKKQGIYIPFIFFFFLSLFRRTAKTEELYRLLKWCCLMLLLGGFLMNCMANHWPRYYVPFRPLILAVGMCELVSCLRRLGSAKVRSIVSAVGISLLAVIGVYQYYAVYMAHQEAPDLNKTWPVLREEDRKAYELVKELTSNKAVIASDISPEVCFVTERRSLRLPQNPKELLEIHDRYIRIDYILIGRQINTWRLNYGSYKTYPDFLSSPQFLDRYEIEKDLPNGAVLYKLRTQKSEGRV